MATYFFKRVDVHYIHIAADSRESAKAELEDLLDCEIETAEGEWELYSEVESIEEPEA